MKTAQDLIDIIESKDIPTKLYGQGSEVITLAKEIAHDDLTAIVSADYPSEDPEAISTPILIIDVRDGVVAMVQDGQQVTASANQLKALVEFANTRTGV